MWKAPERVLDEAGVEAASQALIPTGEQSSSQTHIAATESVSLCVRMKS
jgi:hypothetical protein